MQRAEVLDTAKKCVCGQREQDYGTPEDNFSTIGCLWSTYLRAAHPDFVDLAGYAACAGEIATHSNEQKKTPSQ